MSPVAINEAIKMLTKNGFTVAKDGEIITEYIEKHMNIPIM